MRKASVASLMLSIWFTLAAQQQTRQESSGTDCLAKAKSQAEMDQCAAADLKAAEAELNGTYQAILKQYANQPVFIQRLREAQRAWLRFRDAQIAMKFPVASQQSSRAQYGSVYPMCYGVYKTELTRRRTKELAKWLVGIPEGDVCSGSVRHSEGRK